MGLIYGLQDTIDVFVCDNCDEVVVDNVEMRHEEKPDEDAGTCGACQDKGLLRLQGRYSKETSP